MNKGPNNLPDTRISIPELAPDGKEAAKSWARDVLKNDLSAARENLLQSSARREELEGQIAQSQEQLQMYKDDEARAAAATTDLYQRQRGLDAPETAEASINYAIFRTAIMQNLAIDAQVREARTGGRFDFRYTDTTAIIAALLLPAISSRLADPMRQGMLNNLSQIYPFSGIDAGVAIAIQLGLLPNTDEIRNSANRLQTSLTELTRTPIPQIIHPNGQ